MRNMKIYTAGAFFLTLFAGTQASAQTFNEDVIIIGSECVGQDCVTGESFGFDTVRLKENNLRLHFDDTSNSAGFPDNDWRITINDSSNGGANKFAIDDATAGRTPFTIEAGAPSHSLYVDDGGRIGVGTSTPVVDIHNVSGNTPTLRLEQDGSSGFTPQIWDVAGNEAGFFVRDATNGSNLPFRILPGAASQSLVIDRQGEVLVGSSGTEADAPLHIKKSGDATLLIEGNNNEWEITTNADTGRLTFGAAAKAVKLDPAAQENLFRVGVGGADEIDTNGTLVMRGGPSKWEISNNPVTGRLTFFSPGGGAATGALKFDSDAQENLLRVGVVAGDRIDITGRLVINNTQINVPDYVFEPDFPLESIEEHATQMWERRHLPALPSAKEAKAEGVDLLGHQMGVLEELEKAHIYITQLNDAVKTLESELSSRDESIARLERQMQELLAREH